MSAPTTPYTPTPTPKKKHSKLLIAAIPVALFIGIGLGSAGHATSTTASTAAPVTITVPAPAPSDAIIAPLAPASDATVPDRTVPAGPLTSFSDGTYEVGTGDGQVAPGKYKSTPAADAPGYYARLKNNDGSLGDIIANELSEGQMLLTVKKTDGYVQVNRTTFTKM